MGGGLRVIAQGGMEYNGIYYTGVLAEKDGALYVFFSASQGSQPMVFKFDRQPDNSFVLDAACYQTDYKIAITNGGNTLSAHVAGVSIELNKENAKVSYRNGDTVVPLTTTFYKIFGVKIDEGGIPQINLNLNNFESMSRISPTLKKMAKSLCETALEIPKPKKLAVAAGRGVGRS